MVTDLSDNDANKSSEFENVTYFIHNSQECVCVCGGGLMCRGEPKVVNL